MFEFFTDITTFFNAFTIFGFSLAQIRIILSQILLILGSLEVLVSMIGLIRFPDIYNRLHATTKIATMGAILVLLSVALRHGFLSPMGLKAIAVCVFLFMTAPVGGHMIARAAYNTGVAPCSQTVVDAYSGKRQGDYCDDFDFHEGAYVQINIVDEHDETGKYIENFPKLIKKDIDTLKKVVSEEFSELGDGSDKGIGEEGEEKTEGEGVNTSTETGNAEDKTENKAENKEADKKSENKEAENKEADKK
ncbi:MAG: monovalent cation/H(+) antiporter subunit G, partial [Methanosarcinaceae archaeon]|nr:monovalent cation/H(+) antiporter subunit G [Methanosarcinaceae archaeon]